MKKQQGLIINTQQILLSSFLYLRIYSNEATTAPPLGPILGQNQLSINEFCKDFNSKSQIFIDNLLLSVSVLKNIIKKGDFQIFLKIPTIDFFFDQLVYFDMLKNEYFLYLNEVFDILKIKATEQEISVNKMAIFIFSFLKSTKYLKIIIN